MSRTLVVLSRILIGAALLTGCAGSTTAPATSGRPVPATSGRTPEPSPSGVAGARRIPSGGPIEPGRYYIEKGPWTPATFSFQMPAGWVSENFGQTVSKNPDVEGRGVGWGPAIVDQLYADPCGPNDTLDVGPSAQDLAEALTALPGVELLDSAEIMLGGMPAMRLEVASEAGLEEDDCDPPIGLQIWLDRNGNKYFVLGPAARSLVYLVNVPVGRFVLVAGASNSATPGDFAQMEAIIESITFEP